MLAKVLDELPAGEGYLFEPKWDGFRAIVFRGRRDAYIQSRDLRPLDRYFPELHDALLTGLPDACVVDGEIVIATAHGLDFDALQLRLHPAASRVAKLARESPSSFVAFDLLAACSGFIYALNMGAQAIRSGSIKTALIIGSETLSRFVNWKDRSTCILFGDGAGAFVLQASDQPGGVLSAPGGSSASAGRPKGTSRVLSGCSFRPYFSKRWKSTR